MRLGKTKIIIDTACHLFKENKIDSIIVVAPNGVHQNWIDRELPIHHWDTVERTEFFWNTQSSKDPAFESDFIQKIKTKNKLKWFTFASATLTRDDVRNYIVTIIKNGKCMVVFDESQDYRKHNSKRSRFARAISKRCEYRRILSGTPLENSPLHAWSQFELLEPGALGYKNYSDFEGYFGNFKTIRHSQTGRNIKLLESYHDLDLLKERMSKFVSVKTRDEVEGLPELVVTRREVPLTEEQQEAYKVAKHEFEVLVEDELVTFNEMAPKFIKLQQICSGYLIDEYGSVTKFKENPRLKVLKDEVLRTKGRCIIWCQFQFDLDVVVEMLTGMGREVVQYHGRCSDAQKAHARREMGPDTDPTDGPDFVGQAQSGGAGLNLSAANKVIWYSHGFCAITRQQANERATAIGKVNVQIVDLVAPGIDEYILQNLTDKTDIADAVSKSGLKKGV